MLPVVIGDFLFDLRSALDHIAAMNASGPANQSQFPIFTKDVRVAGSTESVAHGKWYRGWKAFRERTTPAVYTAVESMQPFVTDPINPENAALAVLNNLQNADKHTALNVIDKGVSDLLGFIVRPNDLRIPITGQAIPENTMLPDGEQFLTRTGEDEVELFGTIKVAITGGVDPTHHEIPGTFDVLIDSVRECLPMIEAAMRRA
jgi:hypothetical protein